MRFFRFALMLITLLAIGGGVFPQPTSQAQTPGQLTPGIPVQGALGDDRAQVSWRFEGAANQTVSLSATPIAGDLNPVLSLLGPDGTLLAANDDQRFGDPTARLEGISLPADGQYTVRVTREGLGQGQTSGQYELLLLAGPGSIPAGEDDGTRLWLTRDIQVAAHDLPPLPATAFALQAEHQVRADNTVAYQVLWMLRDPDESGVGWQFEWQAGGRWWLRAVRVGGDVVVEETGVSDLLATPNLNLPLNFTERAGTLAVRVNNEPVAALPLPPDVTLSASTVGRFIFRASDIPSGSPSYEVRGIQLAQLYYASDDPQAVAIPPTAPDQRLFSYQEHPQAIIAELAQRGLISSDQGGIYARINEGYVFTNEVGFLAYPLLGDNTYDDFVLGYTARLTGGPPDTACGVMFRQQDGETFAAALFTPQRDLYLLDYAGGAIMPDSAILRTPVIQSGPAAPNRFVLVVVDQTATLYANGRQLGRLPLTPEAGRLLSLVVLHQPETDAYCLITDGWLWQFE